MYVYVHRWRTCRLSMWHINLSGYCEQGPLLLGSWKKKSSMLGYSNHWRHFWEMNMASNTYLFNFFQVLRQMKEMCLQIPIFYFSTLILFLLLFYTTLCLITKKVMFNFKSCSPVIFDGSWSTKDICIYFYCLLSINIFPCLCFLQ